MDVILQRKIVMESLNLEHVVMQKDVYSAFIPRIGDFIVDSVFEKSLEQVDVKKIILNYETDTCIVDLGYSKILNGDWKHFENTVDFYKKFGWECL